MRRQAVLVCLQAHAHATVYQTTTYIRRRNVVALDALIQHALFAHLVPSAVTDPNSH